MGGGKSKLLKHIIPLIPKEINNYHETFVGGGSVLFAILFTKENKLKSMVIFMLTMLMKN